VLLKKARCQKKKQKEKKETGITKHDILRGLLLLPLLLLFRVFLAKVLGRIHHVGQRRLGLGPLPRLEAAVGIDPQLLGLKIPVPKRKKVHISACAGQPKKKKNRKIETQR
jgi:hypothetical protein